MPGGLGRKAGLAVAGGSPFSKGEDRGIAALIEKLQKIL